MRALDLFAGAGGFSLGLERAGLNVVGAIEHDQYAVQTYKKNFPDVPVFKKAIEDCSNRWLKKTFGMVDLVCGGPPCQGFSVAGPSQYGITDERNGLMLEMGRVVEVFKPKAVILENVKGLLSGKIGTGQKAVDVYFRKLESMGYETQIYKIQAANYGLPQLRQRVFLISLLGGGKFPSLKETHGGLLKPRLTAEDAIADLPEIFHGEKFEPEKGYPTKALSDYQKKMRKGSRQVHNHVAMRHSPRILERIQSISEGDSMKNVSAEHGQRQRNTLAIDGKKQRYKMNYSRIVSNAPSIAITANFQTIHVHPSQDRMLTAREGARLQSFPDSFIFEGPRTLPSKKLLEREGRGHQIGLSQYNQVGNAVPPLLAEKIARELLRGLNG